MPTAITRARAARTTLIVSIVALAGMSVLRAGSVPATAQAATSDAAARGKYLVTGAGQCGDCHGANLGGAPLHIPGPPNVPWAKSVPSLRGLPMFKTDADAIKFLTTATLPDGSNALHPMPHYRFDDVDATAIVTYLRGLT